MIIHSTNAVFQAYQKYNKYYIVIEGVEMEVTEPTFMKLMKAVRFKLVDDYSKMEKIIEPYKDRLVYGRGNS